MSDYRPATGEHLDVLREMKEINDKLNELSRDYAWFHIPSIEVDHSIEGVRCNGRERLRTAIDVYERYTEMEKTFLDFIDRIEKSIKLVKRGRNLFEASFEICESCRGNKGERETSRHWADCSHCSGNGFIDRDLSMIEKAVMLAEDV
jgi:hypothetical protein